ncbi:hypothetical protein CN378_12670 [Bacillus sp. AFS015802]|uniref:hypothetical protein n=1 Tax=Bacillus sp. AFS015802 TaxID=2033486 RepID=UPI000BF847C9|nr:hypothetical protein [Bacillus sp. AFS015802]PFA66862.1 hypothetical protein CN378_12670 [Bacillus sp. AFS015802]
MKTQRTTIKEFLNPGNKKAERPFYKTRTYSFAFNPLMLFDPTFFLIGAGVVLVAILEKQLAGNGFVFIAAALDSILKIAFPIVAVGSMIYLFSHSSFLL